MAPDTSATANLARYQLLRGNNSILRGWGAPRAETNPACARIGFGDGRLGSVRCAEDIPAGTAGGHGKFTAFALEADISALLHEGALEALGGQADFSLNISA